MVSFLNYLRNDWSCLGTISRLCQHDVFSTYLCVDKDLRSRQPGLDDGFGSPVPRRTSDELLGVLPILGWSSHIGIMALCFEVANIRLLISEYTPVRCFWDTLILRPSCNDVFYSYINNSTEIVVSQYILTASTVWVSQITNDWET